MARTQIVVDRPADPSTEFQIERCQVDVDACLDLCSAELSSDTTLEESGVASSCTAQFDGDAKVVLDITYLINNCPVEGFGGALPG